MTRHKTETGRRTTVYRLLGVTDLSAVIRDRYRDSEEFELTDTQVGGLPALLVAGAMPRDEAAWCEAVRALTAEPVSVGGATPAAALLVRIPRGAAGDEEVLALTYGMGFQLIDQAYVDSLFGQRLAVRTVDPTRLRSLTVTTLDERSRTSRATIPGGDSLRGFDLGDIGEAVSRVVGDASITGLTHRGSKPFQLRGADAVSLPLGRTPTELLSDLNIMVAALDSEPPPDLKLLEQLVQVRNPALKLNLTMPLIWRWPGPPAAGSGWPGRTSGLTSTAPPTRGG